MTGRQELYSRLAVWLFSPRPFLAVAAMCVGAHLVVGYHHDQMHAERAMYSRAGQPEPTLIQHFMSDKHANIAGEVHLVGQIKLNESEAVNFGDESSPEWKRVLPIFPVDVEYLAVAQGYLRPHLAAYNQRLQELGYGRPNDPPPSPHVLPNVPLAFVIQNVDGPLDNDLSSERLKALHSDGSTVLVGVRGQMLPTDTVKADLAPSLIKEGFVAAPEMLYIQTEYQDAASAFPTPFHEKFHKFLAFMAFLLGSAGITLLIFSPRIRQKSANASQPAEVEVRGRKSVLKIFQPIATPEEMFSEQSHKRKVSQGRSRVFRGPTGNGLLRVFDLRFRSRP